MITEEDIRGELFPNLALRNLTQITPNAALVERSDANKITAKSVWHPHLYARKDGQVLLAAYARGCTTWRGKGFNAMFYGFPQSNVVGSRTCQFYTPDQVEAGRWMAAIAREFFP